MTTDTTFKLGSFEWIEHQLKVLGYLDEDGTPASDRAVDDETRLEMIRLGMDGHQHGYEGMEMSPHRPKATTGGVYPYEHFYDLGRHHAGTVDQLEDEAAARRDRPFKTYEEAADQTVYTRHDLSENLDARRLLEKFGSDMLVVTGAEVEPEHSIAVCDAAGVWCFDEDRLYNMHVETSREHKAATMVKARRNALMRLDTYFRRAEEDRHFMGMLAVLRPVAVDLKEKGNAPPGLQIVVQREIDSQPRYVPLRNSVFDLATGKELHKSEARTKLVTDRHRIDVRYDEHARSDRIDRLFEHVPADEREYLLDSFGRAMWGVPEKKCIIVHGPANGGKTTLVNALHAALGSQAGVLAEGSMMRGGRNRKDAPNPDDYALVTKRIVTSVESDGWIFDPGTMKAVTGGDLKRIRMPYAREPIDKPVRAMVVIATNELPKMGLADDAVRDRTMIVPYPAVPDDRRDDDMRDGLHKEHASDEDREAFLRILLERAVANPTTKRIDPPRSVLAAVERAVREELGEFGNWIREVMKKADVVRSTSTADVWEAWCAYNEQDPGAEEAGGLARNNVAAKVREFMRLGPVVRFKRKGRSERGWRGWQLQAGLPPEELGEQPTFDDRCSGCGGDHRTEMCPTAVADSMCQGGCGCLIDRCDCTDCAQALSPASA